MMNDKTSMKENEPKEKEYLVFKDIDQKKLDEIYKEAMIQFATNYVKEEPVPKTKPSILAVGGPKEINLERLAPEDIEKYLWMHPAVPRGIEIKANRMVRRGYTITPSILPGSTEASEKAKEATEEMRGLLEISGGTTRIKKWIEDAYAYGNGYMTLVPNKLGDKIVRLNPEHPVFFRIAKDPAKKKSMMATRGDLSFPYEGELKINPATKLPAKFTQVIFAQDKKKFVPFGEELDASQVAHLTFDTWGDEAEGISLVQYLHLTIKYLLNIEEAAAETMHKSGFTQKVVKTEIMTEKDLKKIASNLREINSRDAIILPKGSDVTNLFPGQTQFPEYHPVFLKLIAIRLGIPLPILTGDGTQTNRATIDEQVKDMAADFRADEIQVKQVIDNQIFMPACKLLFGEDFIEFPTFEFNEVKEDKKEKIDNVNLLSQSIQRLTNSVTSLNQAGFSEQAQKLLDYTMKVALIEDEDK